MTEEQIQRGQQWLENLVKLMGIKASVNLKTDTEGLEASPAYWLVLDDAFLTPEQIQLLIGKGGETIDAIQYLANTFLNLGLEREQQQPFTVELNGYRLRRQAELKALAVSVAQEVRQTGQEQEIPHLSSAERRQIHAFFQESEDLETESRGQEPDRRLIVKLR